jgi:hypothetical protein
MNNVYEADTNTGISPEIKREIDPIIDREIDKAFDKVLESTPAIEEITVIQNYESNVGKSDVSHMTLHTVVKGTILYHGTSLKTFNVKNIKLTDKKKQNPIIFSPQIRFAADYISACANPNGGYIHKFVTKNDMKIMILDPYSLPDEWSLDYVNTQYCRSDDYYGKINGVGLYFPKENQLKFSDQLKVTNNDDQDFEIILCNPSADLTYINTSSCISLRNLGEPYNFVANN